VLFSYLHLTLLCTIWILVPLSASDCLSRERREGTLGLLFLTPLRPSDIVIAKGLTHGLRATTLVVAVLPVLMIPFLLGGVSWQQALASAIINLTALCWALASALMASALTRNGLRAMVGAVLLAVCALLVCSVVGGIAARPLLPGNWRGGHLRLDWLFVLGFAIIGSNSRLIWSGLTPIQPTQVLVSLGQSAGIALLALAFAILFAANRLRRSWQEEPPSARMQQMEKVFFQPVIWVSFLNRWMRWKLERNPIGWLEQRRWSGRLVTWTWFAVIVSMQSAALTDRSFFRSYLAWENFMGWLLMLSIAASSAGSFRRERETGVLELLLVSPLKTRQIIGGRLRGLWGQFLPSIITLLGIWLFFAGMFDPEDSLPRIWFFLVTYLVLPVIGLYYSVRCRHFITAFLLTVGTAVVLPILLVAASRVARWSSGYLAGASFVDLSQGAWFLQLLLAVIFARQLHRKLEARAFPLEQAAA
jgi:ABC-type transport system involved in multi-copper enzyme maturation permease subunit